MNKYRSYQYLWIDAKVTLKYMELLKRTLTEWRTEERGTT